jgi:hypothetical protein
MSPIARAIMGEFVRRLDAAARLAKRRDFQLEIPFRRQ